MRRAGHTLLELMVVLPLALLLGVLVVTTIAAQSRLARRIAEQVGRAETERMAASVLPAELRWSAPGDQRTAGEDSVRTRIYRGMAVPCGAAFAWRGIRAPAPEKDSALVIDGAGERVVPLLEAAPSATCQGYTLRLPPQVQPGVVLLFETGTYYLRDRALRFRSGAEGRQPLTEEWLDDARTRLLQSPQGLVNGVQLGLRPLANLRAAETRAISWASPNAGERP